MKCLFYLSIFISLLLSQFLQSQSKTELVRNKLHVISYECKDEVVEFTFDLIGDTTNNLDGIWPKLDFYRIWVDYNSNKELETSYDRVFSPIRIEGDYAVCKSLALEQGRVTQCISETNATCEKMFGTSKNSSKKHVIFRMSIPKKELSDSGTFNVYFEIFDGVGFETCYPLRSKLFDKTFEFSCTIF